MSEIALFVFKSARYKTDCTSLFNPSWIMHFMFPCKSLNRYQKGTHTCLTLIGFMALFELVLYSSAKINIFCAAYRFTTSSRKSWTTFARHPRTMECTIVETSLRTDMGLWCAMRRRSHTLITLLRIYLVWIGTSTIRTAHREDQILFKARSRSTILDLHGWLYSWWVFITSLLVQFLILTCIFTSFIYLFPGDIVGRLDWHNVLRSRCA